LSRDCDYRTAQTPVRDQGNRSACVGFAVAAAHEWMRPHVVRSVEDVLWAAHQVGGDPRVEATAVQYALRGLNRHRHAEEEAWPYSNPAFPAGRPMEARDTQRQADLTTWRRMPRLDLDAIARELEGGGAVILTLGVVPGTWRVDGFVDAPAGRKTPGAHAVLTVGIITQLNDAFVLFKNSWGDAWGIDGYGLISPRYLDAYARDGHVLEPAT
jgi:hypothetical protein